MKNQTKNEPQGSFQFSPFPYLQFPYLTESNLATIFLNILFDQFLWKWPNSSHHHSSLLAHIDDLLCSPGLIVLCRASAWHSAEMLSTHFSGPSITHWFPHYVDISSPHLAPTSCVGSLRHRRPPHSTQTLISFIFLTIPHCGHPP